MMRVVRQRNFALLWSAGLLSILGDWAFYTIMPVFVLDRTGSVFWAGAVWAVIALPSVMLGPFAGVYADRWDRRRIMLVGNLAQATAALVLAMSGSTVGIWLAMTVLLLNASLAALLLPAENALLPTLVDPDDLAPANALNAMNDNLGRIVGPPVERSSMPGSGSTRWPGSMHSRFWPRPCWCDRCGRMWGCARCARSMGAATNRSGSRCAPGSGSFAGGTCSACSFSSSGWSRLPTGQLRR